MTHEEAMRMALPHCNKPMTQATLAKLFMQIAGCAACDAAAEKAAAKKAKAEKVAAKAASIEAVACTMDDESCG